MRRKRKIKLNEILDMVTGSSCDETDTAPPLNVPIPKTGKSIGDKTVKISDKMVEIKDSLLKGTIGDEPGTEENSITGIFTRALTNARKRKKT